MTAKPRIRWCESCKYDNGVHYVEDENGDMIGTRPHLEQHRTLQQAQKLTEQAHAEQTKRAREIVREAAYTLSEFSSNTVRADMDAAQIDGPVIGAAFTWAKDQGLIERIGYEPSTESTTRHPVARWRSIAPSRPVERAS